jgi:hypothetical protein
VRNRADNTVSGYHERYDHPFQTPYEHALNIDFVNDGLGLGARVAVELDAASARALAETILAVLAEAEAGGHIAERAQQSM